MKVFEVLQPDQDRLYNKQHAACYDFALFVKKMAIKYEYEDYESWLASRSTISGWSGWLFSFTGISSVNITHSPQWTLPSLAMLLNREDKIKYDKLVHNVMIAKQKYEHAGGEYR